MKYICLKEVKDYEPKEGDDLLFDIGTRDEINELKSEPSSRSAVPSDGY